MSENNSNTNNTIMAEALIFIVLLLLKVYHVVNWPWWIITMPLWGGIAVFLFLMLVIIVVAFIIKILER